MNWKIVTNHKTTLLLQLLLVIFNQTHPIWSTRMWFTRSGDFLAQTTLHNQLCGFQCEKPGVFVQVFFVVGHVFQFRVPFHCDLSNNIREHWTSQFEGLVTPFTIGWVGGVFPPRQLAPHRKLRLTLNA